MPTLSHKVNGSIENTEAPVEDVEENKDEKIDQSAVQVRKGPKSKKGRATTGRKSNAKPTEMMKPEPAADQVEEQADVDHDLESGPPKTEEVLRLKKDASILFEHVTQQYKTFREKLYNEKLEEVSQELEMLQQPECLHPSYLRQMACVDQRLQKQQREARAFYRYKRQSLEDRTVAERAVIHSQFFQEIRDKREDVLSKLGEDWYAIQKERREAQQDIDDTKLYIYDPRRGTQLHQQAKYNHEVSILSGIAKHVGFPAALEITGVEGPALDDDMTAMKVR